jgi:DNA-binding NtrC family response regulator
MSAVSPLPDARPIPPEAVVRPRRILIVEPDPDVGRQLQQLLEPDARLRVAVTSDGTAVLQDLVAHNTSIVIADLRTPDMDAMRLLQEIKDRNLPVAVVVTAGASTIDEAVHAMQLGAIDFLTKPVDIDHLRRVINTALRERALQDELSYLREQLQTRYSFQNILSKNPQMHAIFELIANLTHTNSTVLIEGATGTGKEQIARAIHQASQARTGPMVAINCAALPDNLLESELFGHEKGAFTSAVGQRIGRFEMAHGGTIFLDEVGDVPPSMQAKLLRVLQERQFERVGGTESIQVDVRVIAATNKSLLKLVKKGTFREDLYYRLDVVKIDVPSLCDRAEDIPLLATHFCQKYAPPGEPAKRISPAAMTMLLNYRWPGNIRELENVIERACVTSQDQVIQPANLPAELSGGALPKLPVEVNIDRPLPELLRQSTIAIERQYIRKALKKARGNVGRCAEICGLSRRSITAKLAEYELDKKQFKHE